MLIIEIPGSKRLIIKHLVLDYNGTLAKDGVIISGVVDKLNLLSEILSIHIITADTFGSVKSQIENIKCECTIISSELQGRQKYNFVKQLGSSDVIAIGNGANDALMLKEAAIGIALIQEEGASGKSILNADLICNDILIALDLLLNPLRIKATLRD